MRRTAETAPAAERVAVHDRGVELVIRRFGQRRAVAGIEVRRVLHHDDRGLHRVERVAAGGEHGPAGLQRIGEMLARLGPFGLAQQRAVERAAAAVDADRDGQDSLPVNP